MKGLTVHIDLPTNDAAEAWRVAALVAGTVEDHFELEVDARDLAVTRTVDWSLHEDDPDADDFEPRPVETLPASGGVL